MKIQVVGSGSWGLALARLLSNNGHEVRLWARMEDKPEELAATRRSPFYLPDMLLPEDVVVSTEIDPGARMAVLAVPSHAMRSVVSELRFSDATIRVNVAKGIENESLLRMSEVITVMSGPVPVVTLSGPSHAEEVSRDKPASLVVAGEDEQARETVQDVFMAPIFRVYTSQDIVGVELGGALKNVIAIAAGCSDGLELGDNARAALITRGLAEIARLGDAMGADRLTFAGLSGMGDLIATCDSTHSRNRTVGVGIGQGKKLDEILGGMHMVAEGVKTAKSAHALSHKRGIEMPITEQVYKVLFEDEEPRHAIAALMTRDAKPERH